ncbi:MAG TPA: ATP-binding protein [Anaerolineales bacterium]|nr:ATP-binding protein [Anaerolineales bacterium]
MLPDFRIRQRDYLLEIGRAITQELNLDKLLARILHISAEMLAGQAGLIALRNEQGGWSVAASHGIPPVFLDYLNPLLGAVPDSDDPAQFELPKINSFLQQITRTASLGLLGGVGLPLIVHSEVIGMIFMFRNYSARFSANDEALLQSFADQAAIAVRNAQLYTQIRHEKQRMDTLLDSVADGILILTSELMIERSNPAFVRLYGTPLDLFVGKPHSEVIRWARLQTGPSLEQAEVDGWPLTPNATLYTEGDLQRPSQRPLPVGITYAPMLSPDGHLMNVIASVRDITHFREAEELKSTFISVISHELKTPVALIKGYVSTLRREDASWNREIVQDSLEVIEEEADRLTELIENLLDATRLQTGTLTLNRSDVNLEQTAERIVARFRTQVSRHTIRVDFAPNFPVILGDEDRLEQVFYNLLSNSVKYSPAGGEISISGQVRPEQIVVCIGDQGPGIAAGDIPHIFDRFYRSSDASRNTKGAGLGLFLSRAVIEAHGGRIWVDPKPGQGARICFSLPR